MDEVYIVLLAFLAVSSVTAQFEYLGCYLDQPKRNLKGEDKDFPDSFTPQMCIDFCKRKVYAYAGLQYRTQCYCGDETPRTTEKMSEGDCNMKCPGDDTKKCGGTWRNSVYKTGAVPMQLEYLGCYLDQSRRMLSGDMKNIPNMTPRKCVGFCKAIGYSYAGLQYRTQCFCGDEKTETMEKVSEVNCNIECPGDDTKKCGGDWRNSMYKTGAVPAVAVQLEYMGCYLDRSSRALSGGMTDIPKLTPQKCVSVCTANGYTYAGLQYRTQCFCGDETPETMEKMSEGDCNMDCPGDGTKKCGRDWRNSLYKAGAVTVTPTVEEAGFYLGCYTDQSDSRKLHGYYQDFPQTLTPQHCVSLCKQKGFLFAGLQYGLRCYCGNGYPSQSDKKPESECNAKCSGNITATCGGIFRNSIYSTSSSNENEVSNSTGCETSVTIVNGKPACRNAVVFEDNFESLSPEKWTHNVQIANEPDYEFVVFNSKPDNAYISNGKLVIKPTLLLENYVRHGELQLENCTGKIGTTDCGYKARSYMILPPVQSARLTTRKSFAFRYGKIDISARLPLGDWLVPELWLEPKDEVYGPGYASGRISIAMTRGNKDLKLDGQDIGYKQLESCVLMGPGDNIRGRTVKREREDGWYKDYHNYSVTWTQDDIIFKIDGEQSQALMTSETKDLANVVGFPNEVVSVWRSGSKIAPFDKDFYISLGVSAGGVRVFQDNCINNGKPKPWKNLELKAMLNFWIDKDSWKPTWQDFTSSLDIDYIKVTAL